MLALSTPIEKLAYVGLRNAPKLKRLGIKTIRDLLWHFPFRYDDFSQVIPIDDINQAGQIISVHGRVAEIKTSRSWRRHLAITDATIEDASGWIHAIWFNQPYLENTLAISTSVSLSGKVALDKKGLYLSNPSYEKIGHNELTHTGRLVPIYPETEGVSSKYLRLLIRRVLAQKPELVDPLPEQLLAKYKFPKIGTALKNIHFPINLADAESAKQRFAFEELLLFQLRTLRDRRQLQTLKAPLINFDKKLVGNFVKSLPFVLTNDQRLAAYEILQDLGRSYPMNRLLNGDVGSGKTVVAVLAAYQTAGAGYQAVFMAPTEILAKQHYQTITALISKEAPNTKFQISKPLKICLLTGSEKPTVKKQLQNHIAKGEVDIIIGTHAVIQKNVKFKNIGLVIIDEQHRFGIQQRMALAKQKNLSAVPHLLSMTATPIPRTLALTVYGDLDISLLKEKPQGRQEIITKVVSHNQRKSAYRFIEQEIAKGRQVFVICPRIQLSAATGNQPPVAGRLSQAKLVWAEVKAVTEEYEKLSQKVFPHRRVAMLHGKLKAKDKDAIMAKFREGNCDILVSTSVIEVGVDIQNATIMLIESADRFGLAQLHQFRGRVGRGREQSYCLLFASEDGLVGRRLQALEKTNNGFELAETDLKIRGPGEFTGLKQSGLPDLAMASLTDLELIKKARLEAKLLIKSDSTLKSYPALLCRLSEMQKLVHFE